jgi:diguanylate cyclase (GGDEF)-like protein
MSLLCLCCFGISFCYTIFYFIIGAYELFYAMLFIAVSSPILFYFCRKGFRRAFITTFAFFCLYSVALHLLNAYCFGYGGSAFFIIAVLLTPHMYPIAKQRVTTILDIFFIIVLTLALLINIYHTPLRAGLVGNTYHIIFTNVALLPCILELYINLFAQNYIKRSRQQLIDNAAKDAVLDVLTGLGNRRMLELHQANLENTSPDVHPLCVAMADVDFFKKINDTYGHSAGDRVLKYTADIMKDTFRKSDLLIRWGGEEFLLFLKHTGIAEAAALMEKFRLKVQNSPMAEGKNRIQVHLTIGVVEHKANTSVYDTISQADELMYEGKLSGRNRVISKIRR